LPGGTFFRLREFTGQGMSIALERRLEMGEISPKEFAH
jgi:hypothetical protein